MSPDKYDIAVIGAGPGGYVAALRAATRGARVCCIERDRPGGTCLQRGCIPTKAMLHRSSIYHDAIGAKFLAHSDGLEVDSPAVMTEVAKTVDNLTKGVHSLLKARNVAMIEGTATLAGRHEIDVTAADGSTTTIEADKIIVATGCSPVRPGFIDFTQPSIWTTDEATTADRLPESVIVIGGGVIGTEFATVYGEFDIPTTVIELESSLLPTLEKDFQRAVTRSLKKLRVKVKTGTKVTSVEATENSVTVETEKGDRFTAEKLLVCIGRTPNLSNLGLEEVGVDLADGLVRVDNDCRTSIHNIYAIGDIATKMQYAHLASRMGIIAADAACGFEIEHRWDVVPEGVYTHPQLASVGYRETDPEPADGVATSVFPLKACGYAQIVGGQTGQVKIHSCPATGTVLGGSIIAPGATELIHEITLAVQHALPIDHIAATIHAHPTLSEAISEAAELAMGLPLHVVK